MHTHTHTHILTYAHTHTHTHTHMQAYAYTDTDRQTDTHTHTHCQTIHTDRRTDILFSLIGMVVFGHVFVLFLFCLLFEGEGSRAEGWIFFFFPLVILRVFKASKTYLGEW